MRLSESTVPGVDNSRECFAETYSSQHREDEAPWEVGDGADRDLPLDEVFECCRHAGKEGRARRVTRKRCVGYATPTKKGYDRCSGAKLAEG